MHDCDTLIIITLYRLNLSVMFTSDMQSFIILNAILTVIDASDNLIMHNRDKGVRSSKFETMACNVDQQNLEYYALKLQIFYSSDNTSFLLSTITEADQGGSLIMYVPLQSALLSGKLSFLLSMATCQRDQYCIPCIPLLT